jgi:asparagine synthase (glutamine-hydrolysing)
MPGILGFTHCDRHSSELILQKMRDIITHNHSYNQSSSQDSLYCDAWIGAARSGETVIQPEPQPLIHDDLYLWLEGEFNNSAQLIQKFNLRPGSDLEIFLSLYTLHQNFSFLSQIDGIYAVIFYNKRQQQVHLISDRYGLRPLYWGIVERSLVWTSELKGFLAFPEFSPRIDLEAIEDFLGLRYLIGDRTWFKDIELLSAATILTWDIQEQSLQKHRYWWWDNLSPMTGSLNENELADELGRLFVEAVKRQTLTPEKVGLTLSGGLDSRAILAAMPHPGYRIQSVTYGKRGCEDIQIAKRVAKVKPTQLQVVELDSENWVKGRIQKIWELDGSASLVHMQFMSALQIIQDQHLLDVILHGSAGDGIVGGNHLFDPKLIDYHVRKRLNLNHFSRSEHHAESVLHRFRAYFASLDNSPHALYIDNRIRSFLLKDSRLSFSYGIECRLPFLDNAFQEFLYTIPDSLKLNNHIYSVMLLRQFPQYFRHIPRQGTGESIAPPGVLRKLRQFSDRVKAKLMREYPVLGNVLSAFTAQERKDSEFHDYANWFHQEPARSLFESIFNYPQALYPEFIDRAQVQQEWQGCLEGRCDRYEQLGLVLTLEIWLQQVFNPQYRNAEIFEEALIRGSSKNRQS